MSNRVLCLIGAGHAHLGVIDAIRKGRLEAGRVVLIEPREAMHYSGMVPGWMAGEYQAEEAMIPLAPLIEQAGLDWYRSKAVAINPAARTVMLSNGQEVAFDIASIAIGGAGRAREILGHDPRLLDIRPIDRFVDSWAALRDRTPSPRRIAIVGGGAGGVELAFGAANDPAFEGADIMLVTGKSGLLPGMNAMVRRRVRAEYARQNVRLVEEEAQFDAGRLTAAGEDFGSLDTILAAVGSGAPAWLRESGLPVSEDGFVKVDRHQQVCGLPHIFAAGDAAHRTDRDIPHSGVHAVYAGPVLAKNLASALCGEKPSAVYRGRGMDFYLLNTGRGEAIVSYGPLGFQGRWLRRLKDWLDRRWIRRFTTPAGG